MGTKTLVSDFDSTMTQHDFFELVRCRWPSSPESDPWNRYVAGELTHFEALAEIFAGIRADEAVMLELIASMKLDPRLAEAVSALRVKGWRIAVASAGCAWYIERLLASAGVSLEVHASPGTFDPAHGLRMTLPLGSKFLSRSTGIDKLAVVKDALATAEVVAFAGDGRPDLEPALLVKPELRFARGWLAEALLQRGEAFRPFKRWSEVADELVRL
jgi:2,3-diketo-5-methylthio-1-phosphopentane phosphatase